MTIEDNKALVAKFYAAFNVGDADGFRAILSPGWKDHPEAPGQKPGAEGLIDVVALFRAAFEGLHITPEVMVAEGEHVTVRIRLEGRHVLDWAGHKPSHGHVVYKGMDMHRIAGGKIAETWHFEDYSTLV